MRLDPLTEAWTIFSEARTVPPAFGSIVHEAESTQLADPFRAGLERFAPHTLHQSPVNYPWQVRVVPNAAPALRVEGDAAASPAMAGAAAIIQAPAIAPLI